MGQVKDNTVQYLSVDRLRSNYYFFMVLRYNYEKIKWVRETARVETRAEPQRRVRRAYSLAPYLLVSKMSQLIWLP